MNDLTSRIFELQHVAHTLLCLGVDNAPIYSDDFVCLNKSVWTLSEELYNQKSRDIAEEANLCLALLMGYNATIYGSGDKEEKKQALLERAFDVLETLSDSLLKVRLLTCCYGEVYEETLLEDAKKIIGSWNKETLSAEQSEVIEALQNVEENRYPFEVMEE